ncbi:AdoMet-dependent rRNA methyltransferase SPB1 [Ceratobasidium sp. AG-Ba]|nr:AdoMet-dependent rRNA methyltransferase SPB1 [Ceratobasidium sp. AG-Ba]
MAKTQKKTGKGRLDKYYKLAKLPRPFCIQAHPAQQEVQLSRVGSMLHRSVRCARRMASSRLENHAVVTFAQDITTSACRAQLRSEMKDWKADVVLHDGAPNVGTAWIQDAYSQSELVLMSLKLAVEFLTPGGTFLFGKVEATKPPSSRNVSAEIFVVCQGFLAPQHIDPKFLDPKHVFKDLSALPPVPSTSTAQPGSKAHNNVFMPEKKRRAREGYADGDYTLFHALPAAEFVQAHDAVLALGTANKITFTTPEEKEWLKLEATTPDVVANCDDLKVLGKGDFKRLLKWRTAIREEIGLEVKDKQIEDATETVEITEEVDEEQQIEDELSRLNAEAASRAKRDRRKANEKRTRTVMRMQLQMTAPLDIGMEFKDDALKGDVFDLSGADGKAVEEKEDESSEEEAVGGLEDELDGLYEQYRARMAERDLKFKAKESRRKDKSREEWAGVRKDEDDEDDESGDESEEGGWDVAQAAKDDQGNSSSDEDEEDEQPAPKRRKLITKLEEPMQKGAASKAAQVWFSHDLFKGVADVGGDDEEEEQDADMESSSEQADEDDFEIAPQDVDDDTPMWDVDDEDEDEAKQKYIKKYGLLTPEAVTLAQQLVNRKTTKTHLINDGFNRYSLNDQNDLPSWFLDDERKHYKANIPITKEAVAALRAKQRALDARPIKKVAEAKARKKFKAQQRLEKAMSKAEGVVATDDMTEKEKAAQVEKLMRKGMSSGKKKKTDVKVVVAKGVNRGVKGRPKGVKGRYAMVDARMRKEVRAKKRKEKANKKRKKN